IPDELIFTYFELLTDLPAEELPKMAEKAKADPRNAKHDLAFTLTQQYHGEQAAHAAREYFEKTIIHKEIPDNIEEYTLVSGNSYSLINLIKDIGFAPSNGEARRLIQQGGV